MATCHLSIDVRRLRVSCTVSGSPRVLNLVVKTSKGDDLFMRTLSKLARVFAKEKSMYTTPLK